MDVLKTVGNGETKPTQIMFKANLSWMLLRQHITDLVAKEILTECKEGDRFRYEMTEKAWSILHAYVKISEEVSLPGDPYATSFMRADSGF